MKELSIEEKAKRFDEVVEEFRGLLEGVHEDKCDIMEEDILKIVPEIKKSEDERIRKLCKELIESAFMNELCNKEERDTCINWLEIQETIDVLDKEEREFADNVDSYRKDMDEFYKKGYNAGREAEKQYWFEKQSERKPDDEVEPKFKVGDWVVDILYDKAMQVLFLEDDGYEFDNGIWVPYTGTEERIHKWTIQDAKDGDVLAVEDKNFATPFVVIYKSLGDTVDEEPTYNSRCFIGFDGNFYTGGEGHVIEGIHPATKEQRDLLFQKMKESGYEWDAEKKKPKKIHVIDEGKAEMDYCFTKMMNGEKINPTWSEEDDSILQGIWDEILANKHDAKEYEWKTYDKFLNWLKSLKERVQCSQTKWKPSEGHIRYLQAVVNDVNNIGSESCCIALRDLLEQLKKL